MYNSIARSSLKVNSSKKLFIASNYKSIGETPNKEHLLQSNLQGNHTEVRLIIVLLSTELQDPENNFPKENKPWEAVNKRFYIKSHHFLTMLVSLKSFCSKVGCFFAIKNASRSFLLQLIIGADIRTFQWKI